MRGNGAANNDKCAGLFKDYQKCLAVSGQPASVRAMRGSPLRSAQVVLKQKGIDKLVDEAREDNKENEAAYMGRR